MIFCGVVWRSVWPFSSGGRSLLVAGLWFFSASAGAVSLVDAWRAVQQRSPVVAAALANVEAAQARVDESRSARLPQINASFGVNSNRRTYATESPVDLTTRERYKSGSAQLSLNMPLLRTSNEVAVLQAEKAVQQQMAQLEAVRLEQSQQLIAAWLGCRLAPSNQHAFFQMQSAVARQLAIMEKGLANGVQSPLEVAEGRARLARVGADEQVHRSSVESARAQLVQMLGPLAPDCTAGPVFEEFDGLLRSVNLTPHPAADRAAENSSSVRVAQLALDVARLDIRKQEAMHEPTLDFVATRNFNAQNNTGSQPGQPGYRSVIGSMGFQLNVPLYSGGALTAKVRGAVAAEGRFAAELETAKRAVEARVISSWASVHAAHAGWHAGLSATANAHAALRQARVGIREGLKSPLDEAVASQKLAQSRLDTIKSVQDFLASMALYSITVAGVDEAWLQMVDDWMAGAGSRTAAFEERFMLRMSMSMSSRLVTPVQD